jgi:hypothetical protein
VRFIEAILSNVYLCSICNFFYIFHMEHGNIGS